LAEKLSTFKVADFIDKHYARSLVLAQSQS